MALRCKRAIVEAIELGRSAVIEYRSVVSGDWLEVRIYPTPAGVSAYYREINERKRAELERETANGFLRLINESDALVELVRAATTFFQQQSGCEAVGIRLREGDDYPYFETRGFPAEFVALENSLCVRDDEGQICRDAADQAIMECLCGDVVCGRFKGSQEFVTERGSFWTNSTTGLLATIGRARPADAHPQPLQRRGLRVGGFDRPARRRGASRTAAAQRPPAPDASRPRTSPSGSAWPTSSP